MLFIISFTLSLLTIVAGLFLLMRSKQETIRFFRIMSWIIISCGILAVIISVHMAVFKMALHHQEKFRKENTFFKKFSDEKCDKLCKTENDDDDDEFCGIPSKDAVMKVIALEKNIAGAIEPAEQSKLILKIVSDNVKLTADQETKIKSAIEESLNKVKDIVPKVTEEVKVVKK
jgi:hypothetical protein